MSATRPPHRLYLAVLAAIAAGALLGHFYPAFAVQLKPLGDLFIRGIKMLIAPIVFCTVVTGIAGMGDLKRVGRVGLKALIYFEVMTTLALGIGWGAAHLLQPGAGMNARPESFDAAAVANYSQAAQHLSAVDFLTHLVPETVTGAFASGEILQVLVVALLFGFALAGLGERGQHVQRLVHDVGEVFFAMVGGLMKLAPIGAFGAMAFTIGKYGLGSLWALGKLVGGVYGTCFLFVLFGLGGILLLCGLHPLRFFAYLREELLLVLGTSSSESALPQLMTKLEKLGCQRSIVGLTIPTGYSFNLDGTCLYLTMAAIFIAQATHTPLTLGQELSMLLLLMVSSKGAAAVTGGGFITLAATLAATHALPVAALSLILGIDRFMSEARALTNLVGNAVATVVVARWEGAFDLEQARRVLAGEALLAPEANEVEQPAVSA